MTPAELLQSKAMLNVMNALFTDLAMKIAGATDTNPKDYHFALIILNSEGHHTSFSTVNGDDLAAVLTEVAAGLTSKPH